jgi:hypothetical protein
MGDSAEVALRRCGTADSQPSRLAPARSCTARHAAVDHELRTRHVAGRVGGKKEHAIRDILCLASLAERYPGFRDLVRINRRVAAGRRWYLRPNRRVDD